MAFEPRGSRQKRTALIPQIRVDDEELAAIHELVQRMSEKDGHGYTMSDVIRLAISRMYEAEVRPGRGQKKGAPKKAPSAKR